MADEEERVSGSSAANVEERGADILSVLQGITEVLQRSFHAQQQPPPPADKDTKTMVALREFKHQKPPAFKGDPDPVAAEQWLEDINKILDALRIRENDARVTLAAYQFTGEAAQWWKMILRAHKVENMSWDQFSQLFLDKYFPAVLREAKIEEFSKLNQGAMTVMEYDARFTELSRYAPELVTTEEKKARKFERGLRPNIRSKVSVLRLPTYAQVLERAIIAEADCEEFKKRREKRHLVSQRLGQPNKKQKTSSSSYGGFPAQEPQQQSRPGSVVCYQCGQPGHIKRDCRQTEGSQSVMGPWKPAGSAQTQPHTQAPQLSSSKGSFQRSQLLSQGSTGIQQRQQTQTKGPEQWRQEQQNQGKVHALAVKLEEVSDHEMMQEPGSFSTMDRVQIKVRGKFIVVDLDMAYRIWGMKEYIHNGDFKSQGPYLQVFIVEGAAQFVTNRR